MHNYKDLLTWLVQDIMLCCKVWFFFLNTQFHLVSFGLTDATGTLFCPSLLTSTHQCLSQTIGVADHQILDYWSLTVFEIIKLVATKGL